MLLIDMKAHQKCQTADVCSNGVKGLWTFLIQI